MNIETGAASPFLDREGPLRTIASAWGSGRAEMVLVHGRRQVGKSTLLRHALAGIPHVFYVGARKAEADILAEFTEQVHRLTGQDFLQRQPFASWDAALSYLGDWAAREQRIVVALDELPYMAEATRALPSIIQRWWDARGRHLPIVLILAGSYVSFMEDLVRESGELFGRRTRQISLEPFDYYDAARFFPTYAPEDRMRAYAILGGMPAYLGAFDGARSLAENIARSILDDGCVLRQEARMVLMEELRSEATYHSIVGAIARGKTRRAEIAHHIAAEPHAIGPYLERLAGMRLIRRALPITDDPDAQVRRGLHVLADHYLRFWFHYVAPNVSYLDAGQAQFVLDAKILPTLDHFVSTPAFEDAARQYLVRRRAAGSLPVTFDRIGAWWHSVRGSTGGEIDVVAIEGGRVRLAGECKWTNEWMKIGDLNALRQRCALARFPADITYALFSRSGFDPDLVALARIEGVLLVSLADMYAMDL